MKIRILEKNHTVHSFELNYKENSSLNRDHLNLISQWVVKQEDNSSISHIKITKIGKKSLTILVNNSFSKVKMDPSNFLKKEIRIITDEPLVDHFFKAHQKLSLFQSLFAQLAKFYHYFTGKPKRIIERDFALLQDITGRYPVEGKVTMHMALKYHLGLLNREKVPDHTQIQTLQQALSISKELKAIRRQTKKKGIQSRKQLSEKLEKKITQAQPGDKILIPVGFHSNGVYREALLEIVQNNNNTSRLRLLGLDPSIAEQFGGQTETSKQRMNPVLEFDGVSSQEISALLPGLIEFSTTKNFSHTEEQQKSITSQFLGFFVFDNPTVEHNLIEYPLPVTGGPAKVLEVYLNIQRPYDKEHYQAARHVETLCSIVEKTKNWVKNPVWRGIVEEAIRETLDQIDREKLKIACSTKSEERMIIFEEALQKIKSINKELKKHPLQIPKISPKKISKTIDAVIALPSIQHPKTTALKQKPSTHFEDLPPLDTSSPQAVLRSLQAYQVRFEELIQKKEWKRLQGEIIEVSRRLPVENQNFWQDVQLEEYRGPNGWNAVLSDLTTKLNFATIRLLSTTFNTEGIRHKTPLAIAQETLFYFNYFLLDQLSKKDASLMEIKQLLQLDLFAAALRPDHDSRYQELSKGSDVKYGWLNIQRNIFKGLRQDNFNGVTVGKDTAILYQKRTRDITSQESKEFPLASPEHLSIMAYLTLPRFQQQHDPLFKELMSQIRYHAFFRKNYLNWRPSLVKNPLRIKKINSHHHHQLSQINTLDLQWVVDWVGAHKDWQIAVTTDKRGINDSFHLNYLEEVTIPGTHIGLGGYWPNLYYSKPPKASGLTGKPFQENFENLMKNYGSFNYLYFAPNKIFHKKSFGSMLEKSQFTCSTQELNGWWLLKDFFSKSKGNLKPTSAYDRKLKKVGEELESLQKTFDLPTWKDLLNSLGYVRNKDKGSHVQSIRGFLTHPEFLDHPFLQRLFEMTLTEVKNEEIPLFNEFMQRLGKQYGVALDQGKFKRAIFINRMLFYTAKNKALESEHLKEMERLALELPYKSDQRYAAEQFLGMLYDQLLQDASFDLSPYYSSILFCRLLFATTPVEKKWKDPVVEFKIEQLFLTKNAEIEKKLIENFDDVTQVLARIHPELKDVKWKQEEEGSFRVEQNTHLYELNLRQGTLMVDQTTLGSLAKEIMQKPEASRLFPREVLEGLWTIKQVDEGVFTYTSLVDNKLSATVDFKEEETPIRYYCKRGGKTYQYVSFKAQEHFFKTNEISKDSDLPPSILFLIQGRLCWQEVTNPRLIVVLEKDKIFAKIHLNSLKKDPKITQATISSIELANNVNYIDGVANQASLTPFLTIEEAPYIYLESQKGKVSTVTYPLMVDDRSGTTWKFSLKNNRIMSDNILGCSLAAQTHSQALPYQFHDYQALENSETGEQFIAIPMRKVVSQAMAQELQPWVTESKLHSPTSFTPNPLFVYRVKKEQQSLEGASSESHFFLSYLFATRKNYHEAFRYFEAGYSLRPLQTEQLQVLFWMQEWQDESAEGVAFRIKIALFLLMQENLHPKLFEQKKKEELQAFIVQKMPALSQSSDLFPFLLTTHEEFNDFMQNIDLEKVGSNPAQLFSPRITAPIAPPLPCMSLIQEKESKNPLTALLWLFMEPSSKKVDLFNEQLYTSCPIWPLRYFSHVWQQLITLDPDSVEFKKLDLALRNYLPSSSLGQNLSIVHLIMHPFSPIKQNSGGDLEAKRILLKIVEARKRGKEIPLFEFKKSFARSRFNWINLTMNRYKNSPQAIQERAELDGFLEKINLLGEDVSVKDPNSFNPIPLEEPDELRFRVTTPPVISQNKEKKFSTQVQPPLLPDAIHREVLRSCFKSKPAENGVLNGHDAFFDEIIRRYPAKPSMVRVLTNEKEDTQKYLETLPQQVHEIQPEAVHSLCQEVLPFEIDQAETELSKQKAAILALVKQFNTPQALLWARKNLGRGESLSFEHLLQWWVKGTLELEGEHNPLISFGIDITKIDLTQLSESIKNYLQLHAKAEHLKRVKNLGEQCLKTPSQELAESFYKTVNISPAFDETHPFARVLMILQYHKGFVIRPDQLQTTEKMATDLSVVIQLIMGSGKTDVILRLLLEVLADGISLPILIQPEETYAQTARDFEKMSREFYGKHLFSFEFSSRSSTSVKDMRQIYKTCENALSQQNYMMMTKRSLLTFKEMMIRRWTEGKIEQATEMAKVLLFIKEKGLAICDEIDTVLNPMKRVILATNQVGIEACKRETACEVMRMILTALIKKLANLIRTNTASRLSPEKHKELLTSAVVHYYHNSPLLSHFDHQEVANYLLGNDDEFDENSSLPPFMEQLKQENLAHYQKVATLRNFFKEGLPSMLKLECNINYGRHGIFTIPYKTKQEPNVGSEFQHEMKRLAVTLADYIHMGISESQLQEIIIYQQQLARKEHQDKHAIGEPILLQETAAVRGFQALIADLGIDNFSLMTCTPQEIRNLHAKMNKNSESRLAFCEKFILPQLTTASESINGTSHDFVELFKSFEGTTGTPSNHLTYADGIHTEMTPGVNGKSYDILLKMNPEIIELPIDPYNPESSLFQAITDTGANFQMIIDGAHYMKNSSNKKIAEKSLEEWPQFESVICDDPKEGLITKTRKGEWVPFNPAERGDKTKELTISKDTGTNVIQDPQALAFMTIGPQTDLRALFQGIWRLREIHLNQKIKFLISKEVSDQIRQLTGKQKITIKEILEYCALNLTESSCQQHYTSECMKITGKPWAKLFNTLTTALAEERAGEVEELKPLFVETKSLSTMYDTYARLHRSGDPQKELKNLEAKEKAKYPDFATMNPALAEWIAEESNFLDSDCLPEKVERIDVAQISTEAEAQIEIEVESETIIEMEIQQMQEEELTVTSDKTRRFKFMDLMKVIKFNPERPASLLMESIKLVEEQSQLSSTIYGLDNFAALDIFDPELAMTLAFMSVDFRKGEEAPPKNTKPTALFGTSRKPLDHLLIVKDRSTQRWSALMMGRGDLAELSCCEAFQWPGHNVMATLVAPRVIDKNPLLLASYS